MTRYLLVEGTHGETQQDQWNSPSGEFVRTVLPACGAVPVCDEPFCWTTAVDGLFGKDTTWQVSGMQLYYYCVPPLCPASRVPSDELVVIAFSHGAQVALYAFAAGLKGSLITVNPPIRSDMDDVITKGLPNIHYWLNLYGDWKDVWAVLGAVGDGHLGIRRQYKQANRNEMVPGAHGAAIRQLGAHAGQWPAWVREVMA